MLPKTKSGVQAFAAWATDFLSFLTKKSGYGFLPLPEAIAGASSHSGAYVGSVRQRNLRTKRNSLHDAKQEELHSAGAVRAKPFRRANCFRPHNLSSKGCNNEHTCLLFATPRQKKARSHAPKQKTNLLPLFFVKKDVKPLQVPNKRQRKPAS